MSVRRSHVCQMLLSSWWCLYGELPLRYSIADGQMQPVSGINIPTTLPHLHLFQDVIGFAEAGPLISLLSCGVGVTADVDELVLRSCLTIWWPFHLPSAPATVLVWGVVVDQVFVWSGKQGGQAGPVRTSLTSLTTLLSAWKTVIVSCSSLAFAHLSAGVKDSILKVTDISCEYMTCMFPIAKLKLACWASVSRKYWNKALYVAAFLAEIWVLYEIRISARKAATYSALLPCRKSPATATGKSDQTKHLDENDGPLTLGRLWLHDLQVSLVSCPRISERERTCNFACSSRDFLSNTQGSLLRHVPHRQTKAGLLGFSFTKVLEQSAVRGRFSGWNLGLINFSEKSGHVQRFASLQKVSSNCNWKIRSNKTSGWKWWPTRPWKIVTPRLAGVAGVLSKDIRKGKNMQLCLFQPRLFEQHPRISASTCSPSPS